MATTVPALGDKQLEAELQMQRKELDKLQERLRGELRTLDAAKGELNRVVDAIERGVSGKEPDLSRTKEAVETAEIRAGGLRKQVAPIEEKIRELTEEVRRREEVAAKAAFEKEYAELCQEGVSVAERIREKLKLLIVEDVANLDAIRVKLGTRFASLGGQNAAFELRRMLFNPARGMEALRDPNVHIAALMQEGWEPRGSVPGEPLELTIRSMGQTAEERRRAKMEQTVR